MAASDPLWDGRMISASDISFGIEEEVFICSPTEPSLESLYCLARLLWRDPRRYYLHSDSNFARGDDLRRGLMSGVEISTRRHSDPVAAIADLRRRRCDLARACGPEVFLVPVGHLLDRDTPSNVCGLHIHIGLPGWARVSAYRRLAHFLPLLALLTASSPCRDGLYYGPSYRMSCGYATGPLRPDPFYRFQDLIISRRLGTVEARLFDPVWDLSRIEVLLRCIRAVILYGHDRPLDLEQYAGLRMLVAEYGYVPQLETLQQDLCGCLDRSGDQPVDRMLFSDPPALRIYDLYRGTGLLSTYSALDQAYRCGSPGIVRPLPAAGRAGPPPRFPHLQRALRVCAGFTGYYVVRLPYKVLKVIRESGRERAVSLP